MKHWRIKKKEPPSYEAWAVVSTTTGNPLMVCFHLENFPYYDAGQLKRCRVILEEDGGA